ncbi:MAG: L-aspartate oxidase [Thermodesulfobacteriota bacterium]|nr:L-aspartate oxidase [Thermodesulfobacteriota bacterium]
MNNDRLKTQALVIGTGIAGCAAALTLADAGLDVTLITADSAPDQGNTALAQGGIVFKSLDEDPKALERDILTAGRDRNYVRAVRYLSRRGPQMVQELLLDRLHIKFAKNPSDESGWDLIKEGGHGKPRILHCADFTGRVIMDGLTEAVTNRPNIRLLTNRTAVDLLTSHHHSTKLEFKYHLTNQCVGAYVYNQDSGQVETVLADFTILATGGIGQIYLHTTNSASSIGSGMVMAHRAGARVVNAEFVQFHPTALLHRAPRRFLISEAMRGAGAKVINGSGEAFLSRYDPRADLAPRDVVTKAIQEEMLKHGEDCVYLDAANFIRRDIQKSFPTIHKKCLEIGIDITKDPIPVVPAAHYFCGGVLVDIHGRTTLSRLYAAGECTCSGVHGANRLASTSLLEGLLWGVGAGRDIIQRYSQRSILSRRLADAVPDWICPGSEENEDPALIAQDWAAIRHTMWNYVGITRTELRLRRAFDDLRNLNKRLQNFYRQTPVSKPIIDLFHGSQAAYIVTMAALRNTESQGCHCRIN